MDLKKNIIQYVETAKIGMDVLKHPGQELMAGEKRNASECRRLLDEIIDAVRRVLDENSREAAERYNAIMEKLHSWREKLAKSDGLYDNASVGLLQTILLDIKEWAKMPIYTPKMLSRKPPAVYEVPEDDLTRAIESENLKQDIGMFLRRCDTLAAEFEKAKSVNDEVMARTMKYKEDLRGLSDKETVIVERYKSGEIDREEAELLLEQVEMDREDIEFQIERMKTPNDGHREMVIRRRKMLLKIEKPIRRVYERVKDNRLHVHAVFAGMDFSTIAGMLNNNVSEADFAHGVENLQEMLITNGVINHQGEVLMDNIEAKLKGLDDLLKPLNKTEEKKGSRLDALLEKDQAKEGRSRLDDLMNRDSQSARKNDDIF